MAYLDRVNPRDRAASIAGVVAVHAALGYALVVGLQATGVIKEDADFGSVFFPLEKPPEPPPPPQVEPNPVAPTPKSPPIYVPPAPTPFATSTPSTSTTDILPPSGPTTFTPGATGTPSVGTIPDLPKDVVAPKFDPVSAKPRNRPGSWITENDYRTSWISQDLKGLAGFRLQISASGQIESCSITRSTGHDVLDRTTCTLLQRRAKFEPARDANGAAVAGTYAGTIEWRIPD